MNKKSILASGAAVLAAAGLAVTAANVASADSSTGSSATSTTAPSAPSGGQQDANGTANGNTDPSKPMRSDEQLLTGDTATKVTAAAKAKEPTATIERVETDSDGVYEAHMVRADGTHIIVQIDASYAVTNVQEMGAGGPGGPGGRGGNGAQGSTGSSSSSGTGQQANGTSTQSPAQS